MSKVRLQKSDRQTVLPKVPIQRSGMDDESRQNEHLFKKDSGVEIKYRRCTVRRSFVQTRKRLWDANKKLQAMAGVLRPASREEEASRILRKQKKASERGTRLARLYKNPDFKILWKILQGWEAQWIYVLTKPQDRKKGMTEPYFFGYCNGHIESIGDLRDLILREYLKAKRHAEETT